MVHIVKHPNMRWTAAYTKPRCEKVVKDYCDRHDITCYLPLRRKAQRYQRRTVETFLPMFPGYVFVQLDGSIQTTLLQSHRVIHTLPLDDQQENHLIQDLNDLQQLEQLAQEAEIIIKPELVPGKPILIASGPLQGTTGIIERRQSQTRITVNIDLLGQSASVEVDAGDLEIEEL